MNPRISVVLPVRDGEAYIAPTIRSILDQSFKDYELLILDDGSRDRTTRIVTGFDDQRVRVLSDGLRKGLAARLNEGVEVARGDYIARMDADDLCFPDRFERQVCFLDHNPEVDLVATRAIVFRSSGWKAIGMFPFRQTHEEISSAPWRGFYMAHPSWMGRSQWFRRFKYRLPEVMRAEDQELLLRALPESRYHVLSDVLLAYRQGGFSFSKTFAARRSLVAAQARIFRERKQYGNLARALFASIVKIAVDGVAALPACERVFFARMGEPVANDVQVAFEALVHRVTGDVDGDVGVDASVGAS